MPSGAKIGMAFSVIATAGAVGMIVIAILKARPQATANVSAIPPTPATSSSVQSPIYDVLSGVGGITPIQDHPDVGGTSIASTNPS